MRQALLYVGLGLLWAVDIACLFLGTGIAAEPPAYILRLPLGELPLYYTLPSFVAPPLTFVLIVFMFWQAKPKGFIGAATYYGLILLLVALFSVVATYFGRPFLKDEVAPQIVSVYLTMGLGGLLAKHEWLATVERNIRQFARIVGKFMAEEREDQAGETITFVSLLTAVMLCAIVIPSVAVIVMQLLGLKAFNLWVRVPETILQYVVVLAIALVVAEAFTSRWRTLPRNAIKRIWVRIARYSTVWFLCWVLCGLGFATVMAAEGRGSLNPWQTNSIWLAALLLAVVPAILGAVFVFIRGDGKAWAEMQPKAALIFLLAGGMCVAAILVQLAAAQTAWQVRVPFQPGVAALLWAGVGATIAMFVTQKPPD